MTSRFDNYSDVTVEIPTLNTNPNWILLSGHAEKILFNVKLYSLIVVITLNLIGNSFIIALMFRQRFQRSSFGVYFVVVAVADIGVGISGDLNAILKMNNINVEIISSSTCKLRQFLLVLCQQLSGYCLSALSVDRCIAICLSHKAQVGSTPCEGILFISPFHLHVVIMEINSSDCKIIA